MSFYAVAKGLNPGIYSNWSECQNQVKGFKGAKYKKFSSEEDNFVISITFSFTLQICSKCLGE